MKTPAPWIARQLSGLLQQRGHAWLLQGPSGLGQYELALGLAQAWLCERPTAQGACGQCDSCHLVDGRAHPDFVALMPETVMLDLDWPLPESAQKEIDDKKRKPSKDIRVEALRDTVAFAQRTSARGRGLAVLVYPAERMNHISANALLKTLEEPPGDARFVLACEATQQLLPTIRSRCQSHAMQWPDETEALDWLQAQGGAAGGPAPTREQLRVWWQASGGRPSDALAWGAAGLTAKVWSELPAAVARGDWGHLANWPAAQQLDVLQKLCHDLMAQASGAPSRFFAPDSLPPAPRMVLLNAWSKDLMAAARSVEHPFNANLMQDAWAARARQVLRPRTTAAG